MYILALVSPIVALTLLVLLVRWLRRWLHLTSSSDTSGLPGSAATGSDRADDDPWGRAEAHHSRWATVALPVVIGIAVLASIAWLSAYLGWASAYVTGRQGPYAGVPPWFGSVGAFIANAFWGGVTAFFVGAFGGVFLSITYLVGRFVLCPDACEPCDEKSDEPDDPDDKG